MIRQASSAGTDRLRPLVGPGTCKVRPGAVLMSTTVLIVDDSLPIRRSLRTWLEQRGGWKVCGEAENGAVAVERVRALKPDVVILDLSMPVMNGLEAARKIASIAPETAMVLFTMHAREHLMKDARNAGILATAGGGFERQNLSILLLWRRHRLVAAQSGIVELRISQDDLAEEMQIGGHHDTRAEMHVWREGHFVGQMVHQESDGHLALAMRLLIDGSGDRSFLEVGCHLREQVGRDQLYW
jgi:DNA-binding NarL/FixJ family response regulator